VSTVTGAIATVHRYALPMTREEVWTRISEVSSYQRWWPWLRAFDAVALAEGDVWRCQVQPPVPYPVRFTVTLEQIAPPTLVRASVHGDVVGDAVLTLEEPGASGDGVGADGGQGAAGGPGADGPAARCVATLHSSLAPGNTALQLVSRFAAPVARFGHDWVLDSGARQFITRAVAPVVGD
jgi:hypothetical protein